MEEEIRPVEIRDLNKTQLIWLAVLLSFVISIATGIVTVTLMQQAPTGVTQTINRVVQQTIEKVTPDYTPGKTQTVIVKEDDLVVDAVSKIRSNTGSLYAVDDGSYVGSVYSLGSGTFVTAVGNIETGRTYTIKKDKIVYDVKKSTSSDELGVAILFASNAQGDEKKLPTVDIGKDADIKPGQTLVMASSDSVQKGTVQSMKDENVKSGDVIVLSWIAIDIGIPLYQLPAGPVVNLDGNLVAFHVENIKGPELVGIDAIEKYIANPVIIPAPTPPATVAP
jgi:hypothetical protein